MYWYDGELSSRKRPWPPGVKKAYDSFRAQRERCGSKNAEKYKYYGARGIQVKYSAREYIGWYLENLRSRKWNDPTVGRLDHDKDYCFENIEMQERVDNSKERNERKPTGGTPRPLHRRPVVAYRDGKHFATFDSVLAAAKFFGKSPAAICNARDGRAKSLADGTILRKAEL